MIKRLFLSRISLIFASGDPHIRLLKSIGYIGEIVKTNGVGLINKRQEMSWGDNDNWVPGYYLFVGRLVPENNLKLLLDFFHKNPNRHLKIIGEGPLRSDLIGFAPNNVEFLGSVDNRDLSKYFDGAIALILPSLAEPWGLVVEEALFHNCYVIISERCGVADIVRKVDNELIFDPLDLQDLSRAVEYVKKKYEEQVTFHIGSELIRRKDLKQVNCYNLNFED